jgi:hypothetical protein
MLEGKSGISNLNMVRGWSFYRSCELGEQQEASRGLEARHASSVLQLEGEDKVFR